jgi:shikimate kinase
VTQKDQPSETPPTPVAQASPSPGHLVTLSPCHRVIFLVGYRGTGKTTVARLLAERLGRPWLDADAVLEERAGRTIRAVFAEEGEAGFRRRESAVLEDLCRCPGHVIATGGGVVLSPDNRARLRAAGAVVWLTADAETIGRRLRGDASTAERRPALTVGGPEEVRQLLRVREPFYRECAHHRLDTAGRDPGEVAEAIVALLGRPGS